MFAYCVSAAYQEAASVARHRPSVARHVERPWVRSKNVYIAEPSGASTDVLRDWRPAPRDRRGVGRLPSRSALIWRTTRSRAGGAGAIETPTPGAVPDFIPVVGRYRTTATWRLSFHCGMNAADTSAWRGIRIGCGHLGLTRFGHHRDPGRVRRGGCERGLILGFGLWRGLMLDGLPVLGQPLPSPLNQIQRVPRPLVRRHLRDPVRHRPGDVDLLPLAP